MGKAVTTATYGMVLAVFAFGMHWLEAQYAVRLFSTEIYTVLLALVCTVAGIWIGSRVQRRTEPASFERNEQVIQTLGLTAKELEVLELLAEGDSNQELAARLFVTTSTIKSHLVHLYQKLDVSRRTQAIQKARSLNIIR